MQLPPPHYSPATNLPSVSPTQHDATCPSQATELMDLRDALPIHLLKDATGLPPHSSPSILRFPPYIARIITGIILICLFLTCLSLAK